MIEQDYPNLEYIIIDDGSKAESVETIKNGMSGQCGFKRAKGEIFGWLSSDDWYHPGALKAFAGNC